MQEVSRFPLRTDEHGEPYDDLGPFCVADRDADATALGDFEVPFKRSRAMGHCHDKEPPSARGPGVPDAPDGRPHSSVPATRLPPHGHCGRRRVQRLPHPRLEDRTRRAGHRDGRDPTVRRMPPGASKWNVIEHRLFPCISVNPRGRPLTGRDVIVDSIAATTVRTGLKVHAEFGPVSSAGSAYRWGRLTTIASWVLRAMTTTASSPGSGFSSRCGTNGGTKM